MKQQQPDWDQRIESDLESIDWILWRNQDTKFFPKSYNEVRLVLQKLVRDMRETQEEPGVRLTDQQLNEVQRIYREAKAIGKQGRRQEASTIGAKALNITNEAAIHQIEADIENTSHLMFSDISVPMPVPTDTRLYQLELGLIHNSPFAQEILAVLKKYHAIGYPGAQEEEEIDLSEVKF